MRYPSDVDAVEKGIVVNLVLLLLAVWNADENQGALEQLVVRLRRMRQSGESFPSDLIANEVSLAVDLDNVAKLQVRKRGCTNELGLVTAVQADKL
jgi:hypothetical protein